MSFQSYAERREYNCLANRRYRWRLKHQPASVHRRSVFRPSNEFEHGLGAIARFYAKIRKLESVCWLWTGTTNRGYGYFKIGIPKMPKTLKTLTTHRLAYMLWKGPIPEGVDLDHLCRLHGCVNPDHLDPVTHRENVVRGTGWAGRLYKRRQTVVKEQERI